MTIAVGRIIAEVIAIEGLEKSGELETEKLRW